MNTQSAYINYKKFSLRYDLVGNRFDAFVDGMGAVVQGARISCLRSARDPQPTLSDYATPSAVRRLSADASALTVTYGGAALGRQDIILGFNCSDRGIELHVGGEGTFSITIEGHLRWGDHDQQQTMAVNLNRSALDLRSAHGPCASCVDNALFDPDSDRALVLDTSGRLRLRYDWAIQAYSFSFATEGQDYARALHLSVKDQVYERALGVTYKKLNPSTTFRTPPVGWMSWYAVQFEAGENTVMQNARWQAEHLKDYGANAIWVDWEWYHRDFASVGDDDLDMYHPDPISYPNGLKAVADQIKALGFIPALWIGPTCDPRKNEMIEQYPEAVMIRKPAWCGQYFLDPSHPKFLGEMLPRMLRQPIDWGYEAIKWDCLPLTLDLCDQCHDTVFAHDLSSREIMLNAFRKARELLGPDYYMLYCAGTTQRDIDLATCVFDAARIGGDIFRWEEFITQCVDKVYKYYALHNVALINDPDNVVLRPKFNSYDQAVTRAAFVSLLGLPFTLGDHLPDLPEDRVEILRRCIPPLPCRPMDIRSAVSDGRTVKLNMAIEKPFMRYNVLDAINLSTGHSAVTIDLNQDVHLDGEDGPYLVYDYFNQEFIGEVTDHFQVELQPHASRVFAIHAKQNEPQVISTSRHISQGALEIADLRFDEPTRALIGTSHVVGGDPYAIVVHAPAQWNIFVEGNHTHSADVHKLCDKVWRVTFHPETIGELRWEIGFQPAYVGEV